MSPSTTGSIQTPAFTLSPFSETYAIHLTLMNNSGNVLRAGQEVVLNGNNTVTARTTGASYPVGTIVTAGTDGEYVTVATPFNRDMQAVAGAAPLTAGTFVRQNGTVDSTGRPVYVAAGAGEFALGIVLAGAGAAQPIRVGVLRTAIKI